MHALALAVQASKALHQVAIDGGAWANVLLLIPLEGPVGAYAFGGEEAVLADVYAYRKAIDELEAKTSKPSDATPDGIRPGPKGSRQSKKSEKAAKAKANAEASKEAGR